MLKVQSRKYDCPLFVADDLSLILLPCFFSHSLVLNKETYVQVDEVIKNFGKKSMLKARWKPKRLPTQRSILF